MFSLDYATIGIISIRILIRELDKIKVWIGMTLLIEIKYLSVVLLKLWF